MSTPFGLYGGYKYESPKTRALGSISREQYAKVWDDQGRLMSKIVSDVSYMAANQRQMQKGIDEANENIIQQVQGLISDFIVLFGGAGDTGLDFGDLKYVIQAVGALFGFADENGNITVPVNLFNVAWHFFSTYILPVENFKDAIDFLIDSAIATVLDLFGEVPILGQALQQLAVIISDIRDLLDPIAGAVQALFDALNIDLDDIDGIGSFFGILKPIWDAIADALDGINLPDFSLIFHEIALWSLPVVQALASAIGVVTALVRIVTGAGTLTDLNNALKSFSLILDPTVNGGLGLNNVGWGTAIVSNLLNPTGLLANLVSGLIPTINIPLLDATILNSGNINLARLGNLFSGGTFITSLLPNITKAMSGDLQGVIDNIYQAINGGSSTNNTLASVKTALLAIPGGNIVGTLAASLVTGVLTTFNIPNLDGSKITGAGSLAQTLVSGLPGLSALLFGSSQGGTNQATDPDCSRPELWTSSLGGTVSISTDQALSGTTSVKQILTTTNFPKLSLIRTSTGADASVSTPSSMLVVQSGDKFYAEYYIRAHASNSGGTRNAHLLFSAFESVGLTQIGSSSAGTNVIPLSSGWLKVSHEYTVPAGADRLRIMHELNSTGIAVGEIFYIDNIVIKEVTPQRDLASAITAALGGSGNLASNVQTALAAIPGGNIVGTLAASLVTGVLTTFNIPNLDGSKITGTGSLAQTLVSGLPGIAALLFGSSQGGTNLATDPDCSRPELWITSQGNTVSISTEQALSGTTSVKAVTTAASFPRVEMLRTSTGVGVGSGQMSSMLVAQAGDKFTAEFNVRSHASNTGPQGIAMNIIQYNSVSGATITNTIGSVVVSNSAGWQKVSHEITVSAGADRLRPSALINSAVATVGDIFYFDDMVIKEVTPQRDLASAITAALGTTGNLAANVQTALAAIPGGNIISALSSTVIPVLNGSKITGTGSLAQSLVSGLPILATILGNGALATSGSNLIANPDFEIPSMWPATASNADIATVDSTDFAHSGTHSRKFTANGVSSVNMRLTYDAQAASAISIRAKAGDKYTIGFWYYLPVSNVGSGNNTVRLQMNSSDSTAVLATNSQFTTPSTVASVTKGTWQYLEWTFTVPVGYDQIRPYAVAVTNANFPAGDVMYIDDVILREETAARNIMSQIFGSTTTLGPILSTAFDLIDGSKLSGAGSIAQSLVASLTTDLGNRVLTSLFHANTNAGSNLILDPSFEDTTIFRKLSTVGTGTGYSTEEKQSGTYSYKVVTRATGGVSDYVFALPNTIVFTNSSPRDPISAIKVQPGQKFNYSTWVKPHAANTHVLGGTVRFGVLWGANDGVTADSSFAVATINDTALVAGWQQITGTTTVPANKYLMWPILWANATDNNNAYYFDNPSVIEVTESQNIIASLFGGTSVLSQISTLAIPFLDASILNSGNVNLLRLGNLFSGGGTSRFLRSFNNIGDSENLLAGSDFEDDDHGWPLTTGRTVATDQFHSGARSLKFSGTVSGSTYTGPPITLKEGDQLYAEAWVRKDSAFNATDARLRMGSNPGNLNDFNLTFTPAAIGVNDTWVKVFATSTARPVGTTGTIPSIVMTGMTAGNFWIDDIVVRRVKKAAWLEDLAGSKIISALSDTVIPILADSKLPGLGILMDSIAQAILGGTSTGYTAANVKSSLLAIPGANIISALSSTIIPVLADSKVPGLGTLMDSIAQAIFGGISTGYTADNVKTGLQAIPDANVPGLNTAVVQAYTAPASNLVQGSDFENDNIWANSFGVNSTDYAWSGTKSRKLTSTAAGSGIDTLWLFHDNVGNSLYKPTASGKTYLIEFQLRKHTSNTGSSNIVLRMAHKDTAGTATTLDIKTVTATTAFVKVAIKHTIPATIAQWCPRISIPTGGTAGDRFYIDNVVVREDSNAIDELTRVADNLVLNPDFEDSNYWRNAVPADNVTAFISSDFARTGTQSMKIIANGAGSNTITQRVCLIHDDTGTPIYVPVTPGKSFQIEIWVRKAAGNVGGSSFNISQMYHDNIGGSFSLGILNTAITAISSTGFTRITTIVTPPIEAIDWTCTIGPLSTVPVGDTFYVDSAVIKPVPAGTWNLQTFSASNASWAVPDGLRYASEAYVGVICGGGKGALGGEVESDTAGLTATGGAGGSSGGYKKVQIIDPSALASTLAVVIGAGASTSGTNGGTTSITGVVTGIPDVSATEFNGEYLASGGVPGRGGAGGSATTGTVGSSSTGFAGTGATGGSSATAAGGAGGAGSLGSGNKTGTAGSAGTAGNTGTTPISGGSGGGGGGGACSNTISLTGNAIGGAGGAGAFPGGGSGGGGAAVCTADASATPTGGAGGTPGNGFAFIMWR